jgi:hypothetical protein
VEVTKLSSKGVEAAKLLGQSPVRAPHLAFFAHDDLALQVAVRLESMDLIHSWLPEITLRQERSRSNPQSSGKSSKYPDLIFHLDVEGSPVRFALEVERTAKESSRYDELVMAYAGASNIHAIIIATRFNAIQEAISNAVRRLSFPLDRRPILFTTIAELDSNPATATLKFGDRVQTIQGIVHEIKSERRIAA